MLTLYHLEVKITHLKTEIHINTPKIGVSSLTCSQVNRDCSLIHGEAPHAQIVDLNNAWEFVEGRPDLREVEAFGYTLHKNVHSIFENIDGCQQDKDRENEGADRVGDFIFRLC